LKSSIDWKVLNRKSFDLLMVDEAHHFPEQTWDEIVKQYFSPFHHGQPIVKRKDVTICYQISPNELRDRAELFVERDFYFFSFIK
jgi:hypothetical protein